MIEIPESYVLANQLNQTIKGKRIQNVEADHSPHKFAWYFGDPAGYHALLSGCVIDGARPVGGMLEIMAGPCRIVFGDGPNLRYYAPGEKIPAKHQLLIEFDDFSYLVAVIQMYGGLWAYRDGDNDNPYYLGSLTKPSPLTTAFDRAYFDGLLAGSPLDKLSAKAFLATEQRIPGLGNGVLQDILFHAGTHPKRKMNTLNTNELDKLFAVIKDTLFEMTARGGRDVQKDIFGCPGGYVTLMSKNTVDKPCATCGTTILKAYLGGAIYYCPHCQV